MSPIRPENRDRYPADWAQVSLAIKERAGWRCECRGECGRPSWHIEPLDGQCVNRHGKPAIREHHAATRAATIAAALADSGQETLL